MATGSHELPLLAPDSWCMCFGADKRSLIVHHRTHSKFCVSLCFVEPMGARARALVIRVSWCDTRVYRGFVIRVGGVASLVDGFASRVYGFVIRIYGFALRVLRFAR